MRKEMGMYHSSLSCERISKSLHNCFGLKTNRTYETESNGKRNSSSSPLQNDNCSCGSQDNIAVSQPKRKVSRKSRRSSKEPSCCKGCDADKDDFSYDICVQSTDSQVISRHPNTSTCSAASSVTQSRHHSDCPHDRKSSGDIPAVCNITESSNKLASRLSMEALVEPKQTIVQANGNEISVKTVTDTRQSEEKLAQNTSNYVNNHQVNATEITLCNNSITETDSLVSNAVKSRDKSKEIVPQAARAKQGGDSSKEVDVNYFHNLVTAETERLNESVEKWNKILLVGNSHCPADVCDEIRTVIGQTRLVISERFTQFTKLVNRAEGRASPTSDQRPVLISDLQGFWEMIYFQVQDVDAKFKSLDKLRENQWKSSIPSPQDNRKTSVKANAKPKSAQRKQPAKKKAPSSEEDRKRREAARKRLAEARKALAHRNQIEQDVGFPVETPPVVCSPSNFVTDNSTNHTKEETVTQVNSDLADANTSRKRPESIVDALSCAVTINQVNTDNASLSSISSTSMVH